MICYRQTREPKISGIIQSEPEGLRTRGTNGVSCGKAQESGASMSKGRRRWMLQHRPREPILPSCSFLFIQTLDGLDD